MGTAKRRDMTGKNGGPGPGNYNYLSKSVEGPKWAMAGKGSEAKQDERPGPGAYNQALKKYIGPSYKIGTASKSYKDLTTKKYVPGPGQYSPSKKEKGPSYGFGSGGRHHKEGSDIPGPG